MNEDGKRIHHRCFSNGRTFTFDEWCDFVHTPEYKETAHTTASGFMFGITDGCNNPHVFGYKNAKCEYEVRTCQSDDGMWTWGYLYNGPTFGGGCWPHYHTDDPDAPAGYHEGPFKTEKECICDCLRYLRRQFKYYGKESLHYNDDGSVFSDCKKEVKDILRHIEADIDRYDPRQLELFE